MWDNFSENRKLFSIPKLLTCFQVYEESVTNSKQNNAKYLKTVLTMQAIKFKTA